MHVQQTHVHYVNVDGVYTKIKVAKTDIIST